MELIYRDINGENQVWLKAYDGFRICLDRGDFEVRTLFSWDGNDRVKNNIYIPRDPDFLGEVFVERIIEARGLREVYRISL
jgi:hypothetical protein